MISLESYKEKVRLDEPFVPVIKTGMTKEACVDELLYFFQEYTGRLTPHLPHETYQEKRRVLHGVLNMLPPNSADTDAMAILDTLLQEEFQTKSILAPKSLSADFKIGKTSVVLWRGDITTIATDAIVNAANNALLGCFQPLHACIDNAIHTASGLQLRDDCNAIMQFQGEKEPTGNAKITRAYNLPSKYVLHTVGPIVQGNVLRHHQGLLANCYESCLEISTKVGDISSIAFCCISTGVFGYPPEEAAKVAFEAVRQWLTKNEHDFERIVFNVFSEKDYNIYKALIDEV